MVSGKKKILGFYIIAQATKKFITTDLIFMKVHIHT